MVPLCLAQHYRRDGSLRHPPPTPFRRLFPYPRPFPIRVFIVPPATIPPCSFVLPPRLRPSMRIGTPSSPRSVSPSTPGPPQLLPRWRLYAVLLSVVFMPLTHPHRISSNSLLIAGYIRCTVFSRAPSTWWRCWNLSLRTCTPKIGTGTPACTSRRGLWITSW